MTLTQFQKLFNFRQFILYSSVGILNTIVGVSFMALGVYLEWSYVAYTLLGYSIAFCVSFTLNFKVTFKVQGKTKKRAIRFLCFNLLNLACAQALQILLIEKYEIQEYVAVAATMVLYTIVGFIVNKKFVYND
tara:strand:- start:117461 stop:117859 length:399 start_codon:yes stop_codon:yes gene_type:complete